MRLLVISDIHGNIFALKSLLSQERISDYDRIVFCGDVVGYFSSVSQTIDTLMDIENLVAVKGNHDEMFLELSRDDVAQDQLIEKYGVSYLAHLNEGQMHFLSQLPERAVLESDGLRIGICHGSWNDPLGGRIYPDTPLLAGSPEIPDDLDLLLCGHTHYAMEKVVGSLRVVNPGSLGQPRDRGGFRYCALDTRTETADFRTVCVSEREIDSLLKSEPNQNLRKYLLGKIYV